MEHPPLTSIETTFSQAKDSPELTSAEPSSEPESPSWRDTLPEDLKNLPSITKFKDQASFIKSYLESEKALSHRVAIPKEDAPDSEFDAFYKKIGRPEDKKYIPDDNRTAEDEALLTAYEEILHNSGLTKKQGRQVFAQMKELSDKIESDAVALKDTQRSENLAVLEKAFGNQMDLRVKQIQAALGQFGGQELAALVEQTNYNPALVQFLSSVGEKLASDRIVTGDSPKLSTSKQAALEEIKRLESDEAFQLQYRSNDFEKRQEAIRRMDGLYKIAYHQTSDI